MTMPEIRRLYDYTDWANALIIDAVRGLPQEQYAQHIPSSYPSIRETLAHMAGAEWIWLERWKGASPAAQPEWILDAPIEQLAASWKSVSDDRRRYLSSLDEEALQRPLSYRNLKGEPFTSGLADVLFHVANHATYHRGQVVTMIRQVGATPPATDLIVYARLGR